jgi:hypothetical protein
MGLKGSVCGKISPIVYWFYRVFLKNSAWEFGNME